MAARQTAFVQGVMDVLETPRAVTAGLLQLVDVRDVLEPAAGSGRMARALRAGGVRVETADIRRGKDFLARTRRHAGDVVTNPPYSNGRAEAFARKALELADGRVCMLLDLGFLCSDRRSPPVGLFGEHRPFLIAVVPYRIYFYTEAGEPIPGQANNHAWVCWPERGSRANNYSTTLAWLPDVRTDAERRRSRRLTQAGARGRRGA
jgi:hypothetical protein